MYKEIEYREFLYHRRMETTKINRYVESVNRAIQYFRDNDSELADGSVTDFQEYVAYLIKKGMNSYDELMAVGRYVYLLDLTKPWIYYAAILGGNSVYPSIRDRLSKIAGSEVCDTIFSQVDVPPLGSDPDKYTEPTFQLMKLLNKELPPEVYRKVLAGNHHRIPVEAFFKHKDWLQMLDGDIDAWLKKMHDASVAELEEQYKKDQVWYEQVITQDIIDYVKNNQEILSGIHEGEWIYNTKFPYAPQKYLEETDPRMKRFYMCHCPLARAAVREDHPKIPMDWCYCSAGFGKLRYDVAFGEETDVEVLESVFSGSDKCRFRIRIPETWRMGQ